MIIKTSLLSSYPYSFHRRMLLLLLFFLIFYSAPAQHGSNLGDPSFSAPIAISPVSTWIGAQLSYNFDDESSTENIVGSAKFRLSAVQQFKSHERFDVLVIGNLARVTSPIGENSNDDLKEITQSTQGLSMGVAPVVYFNPENRHGNYLRSWLALNYKLNGFKRVDSEPAVINLHQFRASLGFEFEGFSIEDGGTFQLGVEASLSSFSRELYQEVFDKSISSLLSLEATCIIPLPGDFGLMGNLTVSRYTRPVFQGGIVVKFR